MKKISLLVSVVFLFGLSAKADDGDGKKFLDATLEKVEEKCKGEEGMDYLSCWSKQSPERCKGLVYMNDRKAWARCVYSCGSAGFYSKTFGECSV